MPRIVLGPALALCVLLGAGSAFAYRCTRVSPNAGPSLVWADREIRWRVDQTIVQAGLLEAAEASFSAWSLPPCTDLRLVRTEVVDAPEVGFAGDGRDGNDVMLRAVWPYGDTALALTTSTFDPETGEIFDADVELNGEGFRFEVVDPMLCATASVSRPPADLANTLTHEVGHVLGLAHPPAVERFAEATMFASAAPCDVDKRTLAADDIEGICAIYPAGEPTRPCFSTDQPDVVVVGEGDGLGGGCSGMPGSGGPLGPMAALAAGLFLRCRRTRRA